MGMLIVDFILERIAEDENLAMEAAQHAERHVEAAGPYDADNPLVRFIAKWTPWRVMSLCVRRRQEVAVHRPVPDAVGGRICATCDGRRGHPEWPCHTLLLLANEWEDHPEFRWEWSLHRQRRLRLL